MDKNLENTIDPKIFTTKDITLASSLVTLKFLMLGVDYQIEGDKVSPICFFKFQDGPELRDAVKRYMQSNVVVEPKIFMTNLRSLKSEIDNYKNNM